MFPSLPSKRAKVTERLESAGSVSFERPILSRKWQPNGTVTFHVGVPKLERRLAHSLSSLGTVGTASGMKRKSTELIFKLNLIFGLFAKLIVILGIVMNVPSIPNFNKPHFFFLFYVFKVEPDNEFFLHLIKKT